MCGIAGLMGGGSRERLTQAALAMRDSIAHRGRDGSGVWVDADAGIALAHRRLSILDLSDVATQPMVSRSERLVLSYNGEVYNFRALRNELVSLGATFRGTGDTEVILAAFEEWGARQSVERFVGMFAFALWDRRDRTLTLGRDRLGIKPLYVGRRGSALAFGSELAALVSAPGPALTIDRDVLASYFRYGCVPAAGCIYEGISQVPPGELWTYHATDTTPTRERYWTAREVVERGVEMPLALTDEEAAEQVESTLSQAVADRLVSDVPLGVFLSGGIDSSVVTALMQRASASPVKTFSIGFREESYDEAADAKKVADYLGTDHTELIFTPDDAMQAIPDLASVYSEPFADSSQLPTLLVCRLAREHVTVALSGDGGDEVFGGYNRHRWGPRVWRGIQRMPLALRRIVTSGLRARSPGEWDAFAQHYAGLIPALRLRTPGDKAHKLAGLLDAANLDELYLRLTSIWQRPTALVLGAHDAASRFTDIAGVSPAEQLMYRDLVSYLPDDILTKVDRASMSIGLEVRVPLLDHRVVEHAWRLPLDHKIRDGVGKRVLRHLLARHMPERLFDRPKMGFGVPIDTWLRGPLRDWAEGLLAPARIRREGYLDHSTVDACWRDHLAGRAARQHELWAVLMFQAWLEARR